MALSERCIGVGLVHHSDRGVQYAADEYTRLLDQHGIRISMSRRRNPYDNAVCESFMKTLKYEEVHRQEYRDLPDALRSLRRFLDKVYNQKRLHFGSGVSLAVRIRAPVVLDESQGGRSAAASFMSFFRHRESFDRCDSIKPGAIRLPLPAHRLDEFRLVIPQQVALPPCLLPLRQPILILGYGTAGGNFLSANGKQWLNFLCHLRGQPQSNI